MLPAVEVGTELIWRYTEQFSTPMMIAINKLDHDNAAFNRTVEQARERFGRAVTVVQYPLAEGSGFNAIVDVLKMTLYQFPHRVVNPKNSQFQTANASAQNSSIMNSSKQSLKTMRR